jgi:hypothetical protein
MTTTTRLLRPGAAYAWLSEAFDARQSERRSRVSLVANAAKYEALMEQSARNRWQTGANAKV